jgi:hypothetical protein
MEIMPLGTESNGTRSVEIRSSEISYKALLRCINGIQGVIVTDTAHDPLNDNTKIILRYKGVVVFIETPFSDYVINCASSSDIFEEFVDKLRRYRVKWWERFF